MSRKKRKSRFIKSDVNAICELQRKVEIYECYITAIAGYLQHRGKLNVVCLVRGTELDDLMQMIWCYIRDTFEELDKKELSKEEDEGLRKLIKEWEEKNHDKQEAERPEEGR